MPGCASADARAAAGILPSLERPLGRGAGRPHAPALRAPLGWGLPPTGHPARLSPGVSRRSSSGARRSTDVATASKLDAVINLAKRRGFVFQSGEIYGGSRSAWDYGPLGVELKENIKQQWWQ